MDGEESVFQLARGDGEIDLAATITLDAAVYLKRCFRIVIYSNATVS